MFRFASTMVDVRCRSRAAVRAERENGESIVTKSGNQRRPRTPIRNQRYRLGVAIASIVALVGTLGAPYKWR